MRSADPADAFVRREDMVDQADKGSDLVDLLFAGLQ